MPASSSGVPEVIGFLNGNVVHNQFSLKAYIIKFVSCSAGVCAGLPIGPEGPMVTIGFVSSVGYFLPNLIKIVYSSFKMERYVSSNAKTFFKNTLV